ncbi:MAG: response regulator [Ignavibacteria bacterium]|nr:response regulator [Ignavibacteria bacterium]
MENTGIKSLPNALYVENDIDAYRLVKVLLKDRCTVILAETGEEMFEVLNKENINLILMDIALDTRYGGLELIRKLRVDDKYKSIPIVAVTAYAMKGDKEMCIESGADDYIAKPIFKIPFLRLIDKYLNQEIN